MAQRTKETTMHQEMFLLLAKDHMREMLAGAERERRRPRPERRASAPQVTLRVDRVLDRERLRELARLAERSLADDAYIVAEMDGRIVAALPIGGGRTLADPAVDAKQLRPLLELRAAQIRRVSTLRRAAWRSRLRRA
jgi:hypothetical protein